MGRLIDADALKANINTAFWSEIEKIIDSAPTIDVPTWIPCSERLPSEETYVLVTFGYGEIGIDLHTVGWANNGWVWHDDAIAWMPLPKPYEETDHE